MYALFMATVIYNLSTKNELTHLTSWTTNAYGYAIKDGSLLVVKTNYVATHAQHLYYNAHNYVCTYTYRQFAT